MDNELDSIPGVVARIARVTDPAYMHALLDRYIAACPLGCAHLDTFMRAGLGELTDEEQALVARIEALGGAAAYGGFRRSTQQALLEHCPTLLTDPPPADA